MGLGTAVHLTATTRLVPVFDPRQSHFVVQLWKNGDVAAVLGELEPLEYPGSVLQEIDGFLSGQELPPLSESQNGELTQALVEAKDGPGAVMLRRVREEGRPDVSIWGPTV